MKLIDLTLYENIRFYVMENQAHFSINMAEKSYIIFSFVMLTERKSTSNNKTSLKHE